MKKQLIQKGAIVVIVLLLFVAYIQYREYKNTHFAVDQKTFHVKNSMNQIMQNIYQQYPGFSLGDAFQYGVGVDINKDIPLVNERRDIKIDKVWLNLGNIFMLYSVDLLKGDKSLKEIPSLQVGKIIMHRDNGTDFTATIEGKELSPKKDMETFNHRVYQYSIMPYNFNVTFTNPDDVKHFKENYLDHVKSITLSDVKIILGKKETALNNIKLAVNYNFDKYLVKTIPINKEIDLGGTLLKIKNYKMFFDHGELNYKAVNASKGHIFKMVADVKVKGKSHTTNWDISEGIPTEFFLENGKQYFPNIKAKSMTIMPTEYGFRDSTPIKIHIDKNQMEALSKNPNSEMKVADIKNGSIFISLKNEINSSGRGFKLIFKYDDQKYPHVGHMTWITTTELKNLQDQKSYVLMSQIIDIKDGKGHVLNTFSVKEVQNGTGADTYHFDGDMIDWFEFSGLDITLQSLEYVNKITVDPITIPLGN